MFPSIGTFVNKTILNLRGKLVNKKRNLSNTILLGIERIFYHNEYINFLFIL